MPGQAVELETRKTPDDKNSMVWLTRMKVDTLTRRLSGAQPAVPRSLQEVTADLARKGGEGGGHEQSCLIADTGVFDPAAIWYSTFWTLMMIALNVSCAVLTPFEVTFLAYSRTGADEIEWLYVANRTIDVLFFLDICITLNTGYQEKATVEQPGHAMVTDRGQIASRYYRSGWLFIDLLSMAPLHLIHTNLKTFRLLRLLRLIKITQLMEPSGFVRQWQVRKGISFNLTELFMCFLAVILFVYYFSCLWYFSSTFEYEDADSSTLTWAEQFYFETKGGYKSQEDYDPFWVFSIALYHGMMTLTTIGYGDVVPSNNTERWISALVMQLCGAAVYAYIIALSTILVSSMQRYELDSQAEADEVTDLCDDYYIAPDVTAKSRDFLIQNSRTTKLSNWIGLLNLMSPALQLQAVQQSLLKIIDNHPCFAQFDLSTRVALCLKFKVRSHYAGEVIVNAGPCQEMCFVQSGLAFAGGSWVPNGAVICGMEALLSNGRNTVPVRSLTETVLLYLTPEDINEVRLRFPIDDGKARRWAICRAFQRDAVLAIRRLMPACFDNKGRRIKGAKLTIKRVSSQQGDSQGGSIMMTSVLPTALDPDLEMEDRGGEGELWYKQGVSGLKETEAAFAKSYPLLQLNLKLTDYLHLQTNLCMLDDNLSHALRQHANLQMKVRRMLERMQKMMAAGGLDDECLAKLKRGEIPTPVVVRVGGGSGSRQGGGTGVGTGQEDLTKDSFEAAALDGGELMGVREGAGHRASAVKLPSRSPTGRRGSFEGFHIREGWCTADIASRITEIMSTHEKIVHANTRYIEGREDEWITVREEMGFSKLDASFRCHPPPVVTGSPQTRFGSTTWQGDGFPDK